jgi:uncharacterized protein YndB with AHSA1/START domain
VNAPRALVYQALLDARAVESWMVPDGMTSRIHTFETTDPAVRGQMTITIRVRDANGAGMRAGADAHSR